MKNTVNRLFIKVVSWITSIAFIMAFRSVSHTCMFMTYQPDLPEELQ